MRGLLRAAIRRARATTDRVQEEHWLAWCDNIDAGVTTGVLWRKLRAVAGGARARPALHPQPQGETERLINTFASRTASAKLPPGTRGHQREAYPDRIGAFTAACREEHATDAPIRPDELVRAIPGKDTAPADDQIPYTFLRNAGPEMQVEII